MAQAVLFSILAVILVEITGRIYATYDVVRRDDLTPNQMLVYLFLFWSLAFIWIIYLLLSEDKTSNLFKDLI